MKSSTTRQLFILSVLLGLVFCGIDAAAPPRMPVATGGRCGDDVGASPFKNPCATHILVADFFAQPSSSEPDFAESVSAQVDRELRRFKEEELTDPKQFDIDVPEGTLEVERLRCFIDGHEQARAIAKAIKADVVIWGKAFCNPKSSPNVQVQMGNLSTRDNANVNIGVVDAGKPYTVCPSATLSSLDRDFRRSSRHDLESLADLDLPALHSSKPFQLVQFALGLHFYERSSYWLAARFFRKSADAVLADERHVETLELALGWAYFELPDLVRSLEYSRKALSRVKNTGSTTEATLLNNIGRALEEQGDHKGALAQYRGALAIDEKSIHEEPGNVARDVNNIGSVLESLGDHVAALEQFRRALATDEKTACGELSGAAYLNNIGSALHGQGNLAGALEQFRQALAIDENAMNLDDPRLAVTLNNIGSVLLEQGDPAGALEQFRRALAIKEKAMGLEHPSVARTLSDIGKALAVQGDHAGALAQHRRALAIDEKTLGKNHPIVALEVNDIGGALEKQCDYAGALKQYHRALTIDENALGPDHPTVASDMNNIGIALHKQGDYVGALAQYRRALAIDENALVQDEQRIAADANNIGAALHAQGDYSGALEQYGRALAIAERTLGPEHPSTRITRDNMAILAAGGSCAVGLGK